MSYDLDKLLGVEPVKKRGRPKKKPEPDISALMDATGAYQKEHNKIMPQVKPGDNTAYVMKNLEVFKLPRVDLMDAEAVQNRIAEYFAIMAKHDAKPTLTGLGMALGVDRRRLYEIRTGNFGNVVGIYRRLPEDVVALITKTYDFLETMWEDYMLNGKINPVSGIFIAKNHYGYQDKTEYVVTPNREREEFSPEEIRSRYMLDDGEDE